MTRNSKHTCIICGNQAGSQEHIFPAALGGRRTSGNIYCHEHNQKFGGFVKRLNDQLAFFNAQLDVRPDRKKTRALTHLQSKDGSNYFLKGESFHLAPSNIKEIDNFEFGKETTLAFSDQQTLDAWVERQKKDGYSVEIKRTGDIVHKLHTKPIPFELHFGGSLMNSVSYLALTFYAHYFRDLIHQTDISFIKDCLCNEEDKKYTCRWDGREYHDVIPQCPYEFGHTVILCVSAKEKKATAWVSFFSSLNFIIDIGNVTVDKDRVQRIDINPLAEKAPKDLITEEIHTSIDHIINPEISLRDMVENKTAEGRIKTLTGKISRYHHRKSLDKISDLLKKGKDNNLIAIEYVEKETQRIFNRLQLANDLFSEELNYIAPIKLALKENPYNFIEEDPEGNLGISEYTNTLLNHAKQTVANDIYNIITNSQNSPESEILDYLTGKEIIISIVCKVLIPAWVDAIRQHN